MNRIIQLLAAGVFLTAVSELVIAGILPVIAGDLHISVALAGQLITAYSLAFAIGTPIVTALASRQEPKKILAGALLLFMLGCLVTFVGTGYPILLLSRIMLGISAGVYLVVTFSTVAKLVPTEKLGGAIGIVVLGFSAAMVLGVPLGIALAARFHWSIIFLLLGALCLIVTLAILRFLPLLEGDTPIPFRRQLPALKSAVIVGALLMTLFRESGNSMLYTYLTPFLQTLLHLSASAVGTVMLVIGLIGIAGSRLGGYAADRFGAPRIIMLGLLIHAAAMTLLPVSTGSSSISLFLIGTTAFAMFATAPAVQAYLIRQAGGAANLVLSLNSSIIHLGLALGAGVGGAAIEAASTVRYNPWLAGGTVALGLAVVGVLSLRRGNELRAAGADRN